MKRNIDICRNCRAMQQHGILPARYVCEDVGIVHIGNAKIYIDSSYTEQEWMNQNIPDKCKCYAEYFLADCNKDEVDK